MNNDNKDMLLIVDQDRRFRDMEAAGQNAVPSDDAENIALIANAYAVARRRVAFVSEHDPEGLRAYRNAGYETIPVNGNRSQVLSARINEWAKMLTDPGHFRHLVVVSPDSEFELLMSRAKQAGSAVHVWAPAKLIPQEFKQPFYNFRDIDEILPKKSETIIYIDYENLHITLERLGFQPDPKKLINAITAVAASLGKVISLEAYADWKQLGQRSQADIQRQLEELSVNTHYLISHHGKNSADMRIVNDIRDAIEPLTGRHNLRKIVLVSGDSDFRDLIYSVREHGKDAVVIGLKINMSADLARSASEVHYLDDMLCGPAQQDEGLRKPLLPWPVQVSFTARVKKILLDRQCEEIDIETIMAELKLDDGLRGMKQAVEQGLLFLGERSEDGVSVQTIRLNSGHPIVSALEYLSHWVPERITSALRKGLPWVDSNFLARGMAMDAKLQEWGLGQNRREADGWLAIVEMMDLIVKKMQAHPNTPGHQVAIWVLPEASQRASAFSAPRAEWPRHTLELSAGKRYLQSSGASVQVNI